MQGRVFVILDLSSIGKYEKCSVFFRLDNKKSVFFYVFQIDGFDFNVFAWIWILLLF